MQSSSQNLKRSNSSEIEAVSRSGSEFRKSESTWRLTGESARVDREWKYHLSRNRYYGASPRFYFESSFYLSSKERERKGGVHSSSANLYRAVIPLYHPLNHPISIFSFYISWHRSGTFRVEYRTESAANTRVCVCSALPARGARDFEARLALLRDVLRIVSGYPVAVFS